MRRCASVERRNQEMVSQAFTTESLIGNSHNTLDSSANKQTFNSVRAQAHIYTHHVLLFATEFAELIGCMILASLTCYWYRDCLCFSRHDREVSSAGEQNIVGVLPKDRSICQIFFDTELLASFSRGLRGLLRCRHDKGGCYHASKSLCDFVYHITSL